MKKAVFITCFEFFPKTRFEPIIKAVTEKGYHVTILTTDFSHSKKDYIADREDSITYIHVPKYTKNISIKRIWSHLYFAKKCYNFLNKIRPDLVYAMIPPNYLGHYVIKYKEKFPDTKIIIDLLDLWPESIPKKWLRLLPPYKIWQNVRNQALQKADKILTFCDYYQSVLKNIFTGKQVKTLRQSKSYSISDEKLANYKSQLASNKIKFAYCGGINHIIDMKSIEEITRGLLTQGYIV